MRRVSWGVRFTFGIANDVLVPHDERNSSVAALQSCHFSNLPKCAACASVYLTECEYAPHTDHRRKGVYKKDIDNLKTKNSTLQTLIHAILNYEEEDVPELVRQIRTCESLEDLADQIVAKEKGLLTKQDTPDSPIYPEDSLTEVQQFEAELSGKMGDLLLDGSVKFIGGTSNLIWLPPGAESEEKVSSPEPGQEIVRTREEAVLSWTNVTQDKELILHLINMYFCWHYAFFTTLSKELFYRDFLRGKPTQNCSALLVNVMLSLGCHFTAWPAARADPENSATTGDHFFKEARRLMYENDELTNARLCTVQALALMSVREAGCGREGKGWVYSGMSFRMACDLGLQVDAPPMSETSSLKDEDIDARKITFWGCFLFDKYAAPVQGGQEQFMLTRLDVGPTTLGAFPFCSFPISQSGSLKCLVTKTRRCGLLTLTLEWSMLILSLPGRVLWLCRYQNLQRSPLIFCFRSTTILRLKSQSASRPN
jgi:hypothetical protein